MKRGIVNIIVTTSFGSISKDGQVKKVKVARIRLSKSDFNTRLLTFSRKSRASLMKFRILIICRIPRPVAPTHLHMTTPAYAHDTNCVRQVP